MFQPRQPTRRLRHFLSVLALFFCPPLLAVSSDDLRDPTLAMTVNERAYPMDVAEFLVRSARLANPQTGWPEGLDALAESQLIAAHARKLAKLPRNQPASASVPADARMEDQYVTQVFSVYARAIDTQIKGLPGRKVEGLLSWQIAADDKAVEKLRRLQASGDREPLLKLAAKTPLARIRLPDGSEQEILADALYLRLGKTDPALLQGADQAFFKARLRQRVQTLFADWWMQVRAGFDAQELTILKTLIAEDQLKDDFLKTRAATGVVDASSRAHLQQLEAAVTVEEIAGWHQENREKFRMLEKVRARHIRCAAETDCMVARAALRQGTDFSVVAQTFSVAEDRTATPAGTLGWVVANAAHNNWLQQFALTLASGAVSDPQRSPADGPFPGTWEIVLVDERVEGFGDSANPKVVAAARADIARRKAVSDYQTLRSELFAAAAIRRNGVGLASRLRQDN